MQFTGGSYLFVAAGNNEAAVWGIPEGGECFKCFRSVPMAEAYRKIESLPVLDMKINLKFNLGKPEILKIILVFKFNKFINIFFVVII